jgi:hypothetical protein
MALFIYPFITTVGNDAAVLSALAMVIHVEQYALYTVNVLDVTWASHLQSLHSPNNLGEVENTKQAP